MRKFIWPDFDNVSFFLQVEDGTEEEFEKLKVEKWRLFCDSVYDNVFVFKKELGSKKEAVAYAKENNIEFV
jgi:hypothetical protein